MADLLESDPVSLAQDLVAVDSVSRISSSAVCDVVEHFMERHGFEIERLTYRDDAGVRKDSVIGKKGSGSRGLAFYSHVDTVPRDEWSTNPHSPVVKNDRLIGLGSCDMKGPLACTMIAAAHVDASILKKPLVIVATADEEVGGGGAHQVAEESRIINKVCPPVLNNLV